MTSIRTPIMGGVEMLLLVLRGKAKLSLLTSV